MCGITGWVSFDRDLAAEEKVIQAMTATMACRGPDESGIWASGPAALGHCRLAVIDPAGGRQPMTAEAGHEPVVITYSGEAYNFTELRRELTARGHRFATRSDTEVVLRGYLEWGEDLAGRLNGMYAFAIWDSRERKLVMIRDRMGIKPLFYYQTEDGVLFGSEPKALFAHPGADRSVSLDGLRELFSFVKTPGHGIWDGVREVEPGTIVRVSAGGVKIRTYWSLRTLEHSDDVDTTVRRVREILADTVQRQIVADVPRCVLVSGGLDSSTVASMMARLLGPEQLRTISVDFLGYEQNFQPFGNRKTPDAPYVRDLVAHLGSDHRDVVLRPEDLADPKVRRKVVRAFDIPIGVGDMNSSLYLLFRATREHATVALSGEAADEVFGGYAWYHIAQAQNADIFPWLWMGPGDRSADPFEHIFPADLDAALDLHDYARDQYRTAITKIERLPSESDDDYRMRKVCYLHLTRFMRVLLDRKDRMSMATGLEVRVPYCDHRLVEYVYNSPWGFKTFDGREKSLLRAAAADVLPQSVIHRGKSPYPSTQDPGYATALRCQASELLSDRAHPVFDIISRDWLTAAVADNRPGITQGDRSGLERALDMAVWLEMYKPKVHLG